VTLPTHVINHPPVGPIELLTETLAITATEGQFLIIYHAEPGGASEQALTRLAGMAAGEHLAHA
jgi:MmyB-like transcription regulator ligand binding domain